MNTTGALILFVGVGVLLFTGVYALSDLHEEVNANDTEIQAQNAMMQTIENPIFMAFGGGLLIVAAIMVVQAYKDM